MKKDVVITEKIFGRLSIPALAIWVIIIIIALSIHFIWTGIKHTEPYIIGGLTTGALIFLGVFSPGYVYDKINELIPTFPILLDLPNEEVDFWVTQNFIKRIFNKKYMLLSGLILPFFILPSILLVNWFEQYNQDFYIKMFDAVLVFLAGYVCSLSLFMYFPLLSALSQLEKQPLKTNSIFRLNEFATPISNTFAKFAFIVSSAYSLMLIIVISGPMKTGFPFYFYSAIGILVTITCFVLPQLKLRNLIRKAKWQILEQVSHEIQKSMKELAKDCSPDNIKRVESLVELHTKMQKLNESSLNSETVSRLLGSILLPVIISLLEKIIKS